MPMDTPIIPAKAASRARGMALWPGGSSRRATRARTTYEPSRPLTATSPNRPNSVRNQSRVLCTMRPWRAKAPWRPMPTTGEVMRSAIDSSMIVSRPDAVSGRLARKLTLDAAVAAMTSPAATDERAGSER